MQQTRFNVTPMDRDNDQVGDILVLEYVVTSPGSLKLPAAVLEYANKLFGAH